MFPVMIWTGLAMSPSFTAAFPATAALLGGRQSARTIHFFVTWLLLLFLLVHVTMVALSGFRKRLRAMITGYPRDRVRDGGPMKSPMELSKNPITRRKLIYGGAAAAAGIQRIGRWQTASRSATV